MASSQKIDNLNKTDTKKSKGSISTMQNKNDSLEKINYENKDYFFAKEKLNPIKLKKKELLEFESIPILISKAENSGKFKEN